MKTFFVTSFLIIIFQIKSNCQNNYPVPKGYTIYKDYDHKTFQLTNDMDGDGINDYVIVYVSSIEENDRIVTVYLSSIYDSIKTYYYFPLFSNFYNLEYQKNVLTISCCNGLGRFCKTLKFKFYDKLKNMRLIGYEEESFGSASHDGAYLKSVNFLTNKYEISGGNRKNKTSKILNFPIITLENIDESKLDSLEEIGSKYLN